MGMFLYHHTVAEIERRNKEKEQEVVPAEPAKPEPKAEEPKPEPKPEVKKKSSKDE